jgi:hypothetical protein
VISGVPTLAGNFQITVTVSNVAGIASAILELQVFDTSSSVTREIWLNAPGTAIKDIPLHLASSEMSSLGNLEGISNYGDNYGERVRGYLVAPITGNYYFWISANSAAELWISNDQEPANKVRRAFVAEPKITTPRQWELQPRQKSAWLALEAGRLLHRSSPQRRQGFKRPLVRWLAAGFNRNEHLSRGRSPRLRACAFCRHTADTNPRHFVLRKHGGAVRRD